MREAPAGRARLATMAEPAAELTALLGAGAGAELVDLTGSAAKAEVETAAGHLVAEAGPGVVLLAVRPRGRPEEREETITLEAAAAQEGRLAQDRMDRLAAAEAGREV